MPKAILQNISKELHQHNSALFAWSTSQWITYIMYPSRVSGEKISRLFDRNRKTGPKCLRDVGIHMRIMGKLNSEAKLHERKGRMSQVHRKHQYLEAEQQMKVRKEEWSVPTAPNASSNAASFWSPRSPACLKKAIAFFQLWMFCVPEKGWNGSGQPTTAVRLRRRHWFRYFGILKSRLPRMHILLPSLSYSLGAEANLLYQSAWR